MSEQIIKLLKAGGFVSGALIGKELGITRSALWKRINSLREKGFKIEASPGKGYRLIDTPDFSVEELRTLIKGQIGKEIIFIKKTSSTNDLARGMEPLHGTVFIADTQTKGRGRLGRLWVSPPNSNIYMSIILKPDILPKDATLLTLISAVSSTRALREQTGIDVTIKWPNDLMIGSRKLGGILLEVRSEPDRIVFALAGIGININMPIKSLPLELRAVSTSILEETGKRFKRTYLIARILNEMEAVLNMPRAFLLNEWRALSSTLGKQVAVTTSNETIKGLAVDIDNEGRLILKTPDGSIKNISSGDLIHLR